ncbi:MAG: Fe(3+)-hydroxamate ABC transporter permease FhuB [Pseudomonadota bacterium]
MARPDKPVAEAPRGWHLPLMVGAMIAVAGAITISIIVNQGGVLPWRAGRILTGSGGIQETLLYYTFLPRVAVSLIAGAMLGLSGAVFQQVLRNPLAEPTTLGVSSGAYLAIVVATLWWPEAVAGSQEFAALLGGALAMALVFALAAGGGFSPLSLILAGLVVGLFAGVATSVLTLFHRESLMSAFIWGTGSLVQEDWRTAAHLAPRLIVALIAVGLLLKPLELLVLEDEGARAAGLPVGLVRVLAVLLAVGMSAVVVSAVGMIGFIGLAAPTLVRLAGARRFRQQALWAPATGAALLWLADQLVQLLNSPTREWPTGIATALLGAPLLLAMLRHLRQAPMSVSNIMPMARRVSRPVLILLGAVFALILAACIAVLLGRNSAGWHWLSMTELHILGPLRWPRVVGACAAGSLLGLAGALMQRLTGNAMASPEILGISTGAALGVILGFLTVDELGRIAQLGFAALGAFATLVLMLVLGMRSSFSPEKMLLTGIGLTTAFGALVTLLMSLGDPRLSMLLTWMAGSTYYVEDGAAVLSVGMATISLVVALTTIRWLEILPLGGQAARSIGVNLSGSRLSVLLVSSVATGAAVLIVGPLSFVGLMAPHIARMVGFQRPASHMFATVLLGSLIMLIADWLGRNILFPFQLPAGLLAAMVGGPYVMWLMWRLNR